MRAFLILIFFVAMPWSFVRLSLAEESSALTASEYYQRGREAFNAENYGLASEMFERLIADFGESKEASEAIRNVRFPYALSLIHAKNFAESLGAIEQALSLDPPLSAPEVRELKFWLGVANLEEKDYATARAALEGFVALFPPGAESNPALRRQFPEAMKIPEARLLIGNAWQLEGDSAKAAEYFREIKPTLIPENRSRAVVLELHGLLEAEQNDAALALVEEEFPSMDAITQLITFQSLTLELGNRWLEAGEDRKAIRCLQRVWTSERLLRHQQAQLADLRTRLQAAEATPKSDPYTKFLLGGLVRKVEREIENFEKIPSFDAAVRLRLASAYQAMGRLREAALILEEMLARLPADDIVEQASANLAQAWFELERWPKVLESSAAFTKKFPKSKQRPMVEYLAGLAAQKAGDFDAAIKRFSALQEEESDFAPRALFMLGFTHLLAEKNSEAIADFEKFGRRFPKHELAGAAAYWRGMGFSMDGQHENSRKAMDAYLKKFPDGAYTGHAAFRKAYSAQQMEDFDTSIRELRAFLRNHSRHEESSSARILLGDALLNEGGIEDGLGVYADVPKSDTTFYEEGVFKSAKALRLIEEEDRLLVLMQDFQKKNPRSPRVAEAISEIGRVYRQRDDPDAARKIYWDAIRKWGNDSAIRSVDELFSALVKLYRAEDERAEYLRLLEKLQKDSESSGDKFLAMRTLWARAMALQKSDPETSRSLLLEAAKRAPVESTNPRLLADFANALAESGNPAAASAMFRDLLKWNPRAPQKAAALAALGFAEVESGKEKPAAAWFERFQKECPPNRSTGRVLLAMATMEEKRGKHVKARETLESVLASEFSTGPQKAEALYRIGAIHMAAGHPGLAVPYFQRIYVMHGRWKDWVAKAYLESGKAFEKLHDSDSARKTYQEMVDNKDLGDLPEFGTAKSRLEALEGPRPSATPDAG